ncbi:MAG: nucleotidyltransferase family protein [Candidatus Dormibacter sp.]
MIAGVLLAAGDSRRFGRVKQLESWDGEPLMARAARSFIDAGLDPVVVVVPMLPAVRASLAGLPVSVVENRDPGRGIGRSIALGIGALPEGAPAALVGVADQPFVDAAVIRRLCAAFIPGRIVTPRYGAHGGNPRIFDRRFFPELVALGGDVGGQSVAATHPDAVLECDFAVRIGLDVDRPEDLERLRGH